MLHGALSGSVHYNPPRHYKDFVKEGKVPVILIPGVLAKWTFLKSLGDKISLEGHPVYVISDLKYNLFSIPESAKILKKVIDDIKKDNKEFQNACIVAHSKGGLIGKYFLIHFNDDKSISKMISLATPYSGSGMAKLLPLDPMKELQNDSLIIKDIKNNINVNHMITSIIPEYDNHVWAEEGSYLDGAKNIKVNIHGHHKIVFDKSVQEVVLNELS
jgi:triacylglycerol lipase